MTQFNLRTFFVFCIVLISTVAFGQTSNDQVNKALNLIEIGNKKQALADMNALAASNPKDPTILGAQAVAMIENNKPLGDVEAVTAKAYDIEHKNVMVRVARGILFGKQGKREDASKEFFQAIKIDDKNIATYLFQARYYLSVDSLKSAEVTLYRAQAVNSNDVRPYLGLAELYEKQRAFELAKEQYEDAKKLEPANTVIMAKLAGLYYRLREYDKSINEWIKITRIDSTYAPAYLETAKIFFKSGQYANAAIYGEKYVKLAPTDEDGIWLLAQALAESGQYQKALPYLEQSSKDDSLKQYTQNYLARSYFFSKEFTKAIDIFKASKTLNPNDLYYYGYSLISVNDTLAGLEKWKESLHGDTVRKKEDQLKVAQQVISFYSTMKLYDSAAEMYLRINTIEPNPDNFIKAGQLFNFAGKADMAKSSFEKALQQNPQNLNAMIGLADVAMKTSAGMADAEKSLDQANVVATTPEQKESLGEAYARLGIQYISQSKQYEKTIGLLENHSLKLLSAKSPYLLNVYKILGAAYLQTKKFEKADEYYQKGQAIDPKDEDIKKGRDFIKQSKGGKK